MGETATFRGRATTSIVGGIIAAPASYIVQRALGAWGVLDPLSDWLGKWLKLNVSPEAAGWTVAVFVVLTIYGIILWRVWRPRHIHHKELPAQTVPIASAERQFIPAKPNPKKERQRDLITQGRNIAFGYTHENPEGGFRAYLEGQRAYADIRPHLSEEYRAKLHAQRTLYAQADGAKYETLVQWFLDEIDRLEREWFPTRAAVQRDAEEARGPDPLPSDGEQFAQFEARVEGRAKIERDKGLSEALAYARSAFGDTVSCKPFRKVSAMPAISSIPSGSSPMMRN